MTGRERISILPEDELLETYLDESAMTNDRESNLCLYGFGSTGLYAYQCLKAQGIKVDFIIDRKLAGQVIDDVDVISLSDAAKRNLEGRECIISLHNNYADLREIGDSLTAAGFSRVSSLLRMRQIVPTFNLSNGYWLDFDFDLNAFSDRISSARALFNDRKSAELFDQVVKFRLTGDLSQYPSPSPADEYVPHDLPRFKSPLRLIDCGAYNGAAIRKFSNSGYVFEKILAFEPDPTNYRELVSNRTEANLKLFLPLATHSKDEILRFASNNGMGSRLGSDGDIHIQASRIDSIQTGFDPNLIKLDVEGAEIDTLLGAESTIRKSRPNLCVSAYHKPGDIYEIALLINAWNLGYEFYLRLHEHNTFGLVLYCLQEQQVE